MTADPLIRSIADLPDGSRAPHIVAAIMGDADLSREARIILAEVFMVLYRRYTQGGKVWVPSDD